MADANRLIGKIEYMKKIIIRLSIITLVGVIALLAILELPHAGRSTSHGIVAKMELPDLTREADEILIGKVIKKINTFRETGVDGQEMVYTRWLIEPTKKLKGQGQQPIIVRVMGGRYGLTIVEAEDAPSFSVGEKVLVFLSPLPDTTNEYWIRGEFQGKFKIDKSSDNVETAIQQESEKMIILNDLEKEIKADIDENKVKI